MAATTTATPGDAPSYAPLPPAPKPRRIIYHKELGKVYVMPSSNEVRQRRLAGGIAAGVAVVCLWQGTRMARAMEFLGAVRSGNADTVRSYLASGVSAETHSLFDRRSALDIAVAQGDAPLASVLLQSGAEVTAPMLNTAAVHGNAPLLYTLLDRYGETRLSAEEKGQLLCSAAQSGDMDSVKFLLHRGAPTTARNAHDEDMTPLMYAARSGKPGVVYTLLEAGADLKARTSKGVTVLMLAATWNAPITCQYLLKNKADVNATDNAGNTALMLAASVGNVATTDLLLGYGASVNAKNKAGESVLGWATQSGSDHVIALLKRHGAHP